MGIFARWVFYRGGEGGLGGAGVCLVALPAERGTRASCSPAQDTLPHTYNDMLLRADYGRVIEGRVLAGQAFTCLPPELCHESRVHRKGALLS